MTDLAIAFPARGIPSTQRLMDYARWADEAGFRAAFVPEAITDSMASLQAMAAATGRIQVGSGIANIFLRHPILQAMTAQMIDEVSHGRLILGLGISHKGIVEGRFGIPFDRPRDRLREYVEILRGAFSGEVVDYEGEIYRVKDWQTGVPLTRPRIPIYLAVLGLKMAHFAGQIADGVILNLASVDHTRRVVEAVREGARSAGRDPDTIEIASFIACCIDEDRETAQNTARRILSFYSTMPFYSNMFKQEGFEREALEVADAVRKGDRDAAFRSMTVPMIDAIALCGTPDEVRARMGDHRRAGVTMPVVSPSPTRRSLDQAIEIAIEAFRPDLSRA